MESICLTPLDPAYPSRLRGLSSAPATLTVRGGPLEADRVVAIVGSREAHPEAVTFARKLAGELAREGVVVASGGALGIDAAAHEGTLEAGGRTWCLAGTGERHCFPPEHAELFARIASGPGAMVWPFAPDLGARARLFHQRNNVLVALSDAVVVVQAALQSGALSTAARALRQRKPLWVVPVSPWLLDEKDERCDFAGSRRLLDGGVRPLQAVGPLLGSLAHLVRNPRDRAASDAAGRLLAGLPAPLEPPLHLDEIAARAHLSPQAATAALLTLALENVVVEGPPGFFRRRDAS
ncbi:MAG TPA: DNA-processing protein DprA [Polyangiaceae bacterium]